MTPWVRRIAAAISGKPILLVALLLTVCTWCAAAQIYWVVQQVPHHGETAAAVLVGVDVAYAWLLVSFLLALRQDLEELRLPQLRPLLTASLIFVLAMVFVIPCAAVWALGGDVWDVSFMAIGSVVGTAGPPLWRSGTRARKAPHAPLTAANVLSPVPAQRPQPWRAVRVALGAPYAPQPWWQRVIELASLCMLLAGAPLLVLFFKSALNPRGYVILLHVAEFMSFVIAIGLCWVWPLVRAVTLVTSQSGTLTELALLPGQGSGRQQWRRLCLVALSMPTVALLVLLVLALGLVALEHLPVAIYAKVGVEFLLVLLLTLPALANRLTKQRAPNAWAGAMIMFSQAWTWLVIFWTATPESWRGAPAMIRWAGVVIIAVGLTLLVGLAVHSLRKLWRRPHPYMEVSS